MTPFGQAYAKLAHNTFMTQWISDIEDTERLIEICTEEIQKAGYPVSDETEDDWMEYIYAASDMWEIATNGFVYKKERNPQKRDGWEFVLYTRMNHPAFEKEWDENHGLD